MKVQFEKRLKDYNSRFFTINERENLDFVFLLLQHKGSSIKYVRKIFRKTNISNLLIRLRASEKIFFLKEKLLKNYFFKKIAELVRNLLVNLRRYFEKGNKY